MENAIYQVRKHGSVKTNTKKEAEVLVNIAKKQGYNFSQKKVGWSFLVEDQDN